MRINMKFTVLYRSAICALSVSIISLSAVQNANAGAYWKDSSGQLVRTGYGECWRTIEWTAETALPECEGIEPKVDDRPKKRAMAHASDKDGDGIEDKKDQCPDTAAKTKVDSKGCPKDSDGDGIINEQDDCPDTAKGTAVNNRGCALKESIDLSNVEFATGTAKLSAASQSELDGVAAVLVRNDHLNFEVAGHTDNAGNYNGNVSLSQKRADAVRSYLVSQGVTGSRLTAKGYGPDKPVADNSTANGRARNRRVEMVLK
jgi:outer membrane protein OmpA-like peptidoglycan-associated protein